jgi:hypothetical protein
VVAVVFIEMAVQSEKFSVSVDVAVSARKVNPEPCGITIVKGGPEAV